MSNLAVKYKRKQSPSHIPKQALPVTKKAKVTLIEKVLYGTLIVFLICASVIFINNKAQLYAVNTEASKLQIEIKEQMKINNDLTAEMESLSRYERIAKKAKEMGLEINENNVKGLTP